MAILCRSRPIRFTHDNVYSYNLQVASNHAQNSIGNKYVSSVSQCQNSAFNIFDLLARGHLVAQSISIVAKFRIPD